MRAGSGPGPLASAGGLAVLTIAVLGTSAPCVWAAVVAAVLWAAWVAPPALWSLRGRWFLGFALLATVPLALWTEPRDWTLLPGLSVSRAGTATGLAMVGRGLLVWLTVASLLWKCPPTRWSPALERVGLHGFGFALGVAFHMLGDVLRSVSTAWASLKMRGGIRTHGWRGVQLLGVTVISGALAHVDDITAAAQMRGYHPGNTPKEPVRVDGRELVAVGLLAAAGLTLRMLLG